MGAVCCAVRFVVTSSAIGSARRDHARIEEIIFLPRLFDREL